jgi:hypothetical protein
MAQDLQPPFGVIHVHEAILCKLGQLAENFSTYTQQDGELMSIFDSKDNQVALVTVVSATYGCTKLPFPSPSSRHINILRNALANATVNIVDDSVMLCLTEMTNNALIERAAHHFYNSPDMEQEVSPQGHSSA